jgi:hypothetical protein
LARSSLKPKGRLEWAIRLPVHSVLYFPPTGLIYNVSEFVFESRERRQDAQITESPQQFGDPMN